MTTGKSQQRDELLTTVRGALRRAELCCADSSLGYLLVDHQHHLRSSGHYPCRWHGHRWQDRTGRRGRMADSVVSRLQKGASHDLGHSMPRFRPAIYQLKTNWRHSAAFQKSTLLVWLEMMPPKPGPRHYASRNRVALRR